MLLPINFCSLNDGTANKNEFKISKLMFFGQSVGPTIPSNLFLISSNIKEKIDPQRRRLHLYRPNYLENMNQI